MRFKHVFTGIMTLAMVLLSSTSLMAAFGEDIERPKPTFVQDGGDWIAELIPRGKSTRIQIRFHAEGGILAEPSPKIFTEEDTPEIDVKNYRSGFFVVEMTPAQKGGEITLSMASSYFNSATDIWGVTERASKTWGTTGVSAQVVKGEPAVLTFKVKDGSLLDEDEEANGRIQIIIAPRDHFWGYAIGTLVIRFFGVFLVLGILMIGMILSGRWFQSRDEKGSPPLKAPLSTPSLDEEIEIPMMPPDPVPGGVTSATAAAIGLALHLESEKRKKPKALPAGTQMQASSNWSFSGRTQLMANRMGTLGRVHPNK